MTRGQESTNRLFHVCCIHRLHQWDGSRLSMPKPEDLALYICMDSVFFCRIPSKPASRLGLGAVLQDSRNDVFLILPISFISARSENQTSFDAQRAFCLSWLSLAVICMDRDWIISGPKPTLSPYCILCKSHHLSDEFFQMWHLSKQLSFSLGYLPN